MSHPEATPQLVSLRTIATKGGETFDLHEHTFHEFTLVTDDQTFIGYKPGWLEAKPNTLIHYRPGERHGAWVSPVQRPRFWVVHFDLPPDDRFHLDSFRHESAEKRAWTLTASQVEMFQWMFLQLLDERSADREHQRLATSAWLQLLLVTVHRWALRRGGPETNVSIRPTPEVLRLWHMINEAVSKPNDELREIYASPNYDSIRHAFRKAFGCSPRDMLFRLRMEHACNLLLESSLSIKEISERIGYARQHEFYRAFRKHVGCAPSEWRANPLVRRPAAK